MILANGIFDLLKIILPAFIVFLTVYYMLRSYLKQTYKLEELKIIKNQNKDLLHLKLQAYERLIIFCERISADNLFFRLNHADMGVKELRNSMLIAIQQEFEHNITQQLYTSESLWKIVILAKDFMLELVSRTEGNSIKEFTNNVRINISDNKFDPTQYAKTAIANEVELIISVK